MHSGLITHPRQQGIIAGLSDNAFMDSLNPYSSYDTRGYPQDVRNCEQWKKGYAIGQALREIAEESGKIL